jgi:hypothetical protein
MTWRNELVFVGAHGWLCAQPPKIRIVIDWVYT